jgi:hypothetical protein
MVLDFMTVPPHSKTPITMISLSSGLSHILSSAHTSHEPASDGDTGQHQHGVQVTPTQFEHSPSIVNGLSEDQFVGLIIALVIVLAIIIGCYYKRQRRRRQGMPECV